MCHNKHILYFSEMITGPVLVIIFIIFPSKYFVLRKNIYTFAIKLINHP